MTLNYKAPISGTKSSIDSNSTGTQMQSFLWMKKALIESRKEQYFMPLSSTVNMPKHYGQTIKRNIYVPLLDDRNINDQGIDATGATIANGNLYGSSKDVGTIEGMLPVLGENGGRVNRVGFSRLEIEGSLHQFGFFYEFTKASIDFDSDEMLKEHLSRELMNGATQITEAVLQKDLLAAAGVIQYGGAAVSDATMTGEVVPEVPGTSPEMPISVLTYAGLSRIDQTLTDNRTPRQTTIIKGSGYTDTRTLPASRVAYIGSELVPVVKAMKDSFQERAFIPVHQYADAGNVLNGEIGSVDNIRFVQVPEMLHWAGKGRAATAANPGYRTTTVGGTEKYNIYPMLIVGDDSFNTIAFQSDGKTVKFDVITKMPGKDTANAATDPYGLKGFSSIRWFYGILINRPERIALYKSVAPV